MDVNPLKKMNCNACKKALNAKESLKCRLCLARFHHQCLNIEKQQFLAINKGQAANWVCPACNSITRRVRSNDNTPVRQSNLFHDDDTLDMSCDVMSDQNTSSAPPPATQTVEVVSNVTMDKISHLLDEKLNASLTAFMENFRKALREDVREMVQTEIESALRNIRDDFSATTDFICEEQKSMQTELKKTTDKISHLEHENSKLQSEVNKLVGRLTGIEKMSRSCNIELQAVPERKNENILAMLKKLCDVVRVTLDDGHISACRRVAKINAASSRPRNIVVTFVAPRIRDMVLSAVHRYKKANSGTGLKSGDLEIPGESCNIFVTEHLSPEQKSLHAATRKAAKEHDYKYVWVKYGQIYVRKSDSFGAILVRDFDSLSKLRN
jgi:hypothetical protein